MWKIRNVYCCELNYHDGFKVTGYEQLDNEYKSIGVHFLILINFFIQLVISVYSFLKYFKTDYYD